MYPGSGTARRARTTASVSYGLLESLRPPARRMLATVLVMFTLAGTFAAAAGTGTDHPFQVTIISSGSSDLDARLTQALSERLPFPLDIQVRSEPEGDPDLIVALGPNALLQSLSEAVAAPVLALYVTSDGFREFTKPGAAPTDRAALDAQVSAIFHDPPLERQALLGRLLIPSAERVSLLDGIDSRAVRAAELRQISALGLTPELFPVNGPSNLIPILNRALDYGDFVLGTPSPGVYNRNTIKHLLLTAYRRNQFLIGPSRAFVGAGALASTYTSFEQLATETAEFIARFRDTGNLPAAGFPARFEVEVNRQVARSLNLVTPANDELKERMMSLQPTGSNRSGEVSP